VIFESRNHSPAFGGTELLPDTPSHIHGENCAFADGRVQLVARKWLGLDKHGKSIWAKEPAADWVIWRPVLKKGEEGHQ